MTDRNDNNDKHKNKHHNEQMQTYQQVYEINRKWMMCAARRCSAVQYSTQEAVPTPAEEKQMLAAFWSLSEV